MVVALVLSVLANVGIVAAFLRHLSKERHADRLNVASLLNRIQAPEKAVQQHIAETTPLSTQPLHVPYDDDSAYWKAQEKYE